MNDGTSEDIPTADVEEIFLNALEHREGTEREAFLRDACGTNAKLHAAVESLISDHRLATNLFRESTRDLDFEGNGTSDDATESVISVGPYRIVRLLGEGGGGTVYEAEQTTPIHRRVALKILKPGTDASRFVELFETERQTLALMEHPNIARVLDAGATEDGRPYFAMDLVHGTRITDYCARNNIPVAERLRLVSQVCAAVQHAHNKGVIHRDLKPSNILVTLIDGIPVPKVIDFGIARAITTKGGNPDVTQHQWVGTPSYMSPEQFGDTDDIDTRSDVYGLGVVLYELIAGRPPFDNNDLMMAGPEAMRRRIREEIPMPPSAYSGERERKTFSELDYIILKAMEKDRERRYPTVQMLSADIDRFLRNEPLLAHPPSQWYRMRKLVVRNRLVSATFVAGLLALAAGCTTSTLLYLRAKTAEREQARLRADSEEREHVTKAAILLMQGRTADADAEIRKMGGVLTQPSLEATRVFHDLATWSAMRGDWKTSADRWLALSRVNRFDDSDMTDNATRDLLPIVPTLITCGDFDRFHEFQHLVLSRLGKTTNLIAAEHLLKMCLQIPASPEILASLAPAAGVAEQSFDGKDVTPRDRIEAWRCVVLGLWHYRNGDNTAAILWCNRAMRLHESEVVRDTQAMLIRAMARKSVGDDAGAEADLDRARASITRRFSQPLDFNTGGYWHDWLDARILLGEAEAQIKEPTHS